MRIVLAFLALCQFIFGQVSATTITASDPAGNRYGIGAAGHLTKVAADRKTTLWETDLGGRVPASLALDSAGNLYAGGAFGTRGFLTILDSGGKPVSTTELERPVAAVALDTAGSVYLGGNGFVMKSGDWSVAAPSTLRSLAVAQNGFVFAGGDGFVGKLTPDGSRWAWTYWLTADPATTQVRSLALAPDGGVYLTGETSSDLLPLRNAHQARKQGPTDAFVARLSADGQLLWSTYLGGDGNDSANLLVLDPQGNPVVGGSSFTARFDEDGHLKGSMTPTGGPVLQLAFDAEGGLVTTMASRTLTEPGTRSRGAAPAALTAHVLTATTTTLTSAHNPNRYTDFQISLKATLSPSTATGTVVFYDGPNVLEVRTLFNGVATAQFSSTLKPGKHTLWARYLGDASNASSVSSNLQQSVTAVKGTGFSVTNPFTAAQAPFVTAGVLNSSGHRWVVSTGPSNKVSVVSSGSFNFDLTIGGGLSPVPGSPYTVGTSPTSVAMADFNGDGYNDLAVTNYGSNNVTILLTQVDTNGSVTGLSGTPIGMTASAASPVSVGSGPQYAAAGDFNGDGKSDLAVVNFNDGTMTILIGDGTGGFPTASRHTYNTENNPWFVAVGDFNNDNKTDLVVANGGSNSMIEYLGNGDGTFFAAYGFAVGSSPRSIAVDDFNGDGYADLAVTSYNDNSVAVWLNTVTGFTQAAGIALPSGSNPWSIVSSDFDADGKIDLAISGYSSNKVYLYSGNGSGGFTQASTSPISVANGPSALAIADFNIDGVVDLVASTQASSGPTLLFGRPGSTTSLTAQSGASFTTSTYGNSVSLVATITPSAATGTVVYYDGVTLLGSAVISAGAGTASFSTRALTPGTHSITARYVGSAAYVGSVSSSLSFTVTSSNASAFVSQGTVAHPNAGQVVPIVIAGTKGFVAISTNEVKVWTANGSTYGQYAQLATDDAPVAAAVADFNGDGKQDVAVTNITGVMNIYLGNDAGGFSNDLISCGDNPVAVSAADFNGDGYTDLAVVNQLGSGTVRIFLGNGNGTFHEGTTVSVGSNPWSATVADVNGDGKADLVVPNGSSSNAHVLLGNGDGTFTAWSILPVGSSARSAAVADFNGDGRADVAIANYNDNTVSLFLMNAQGTALVKQTDFALPSGSNPNSVIAFDFTADGKMDLLVTGHLNGILYLLSGNGDGTFSLTSQYATGGQPVNVVVQEMNADGRPDLVVSNTAGNIQVLRGALQASLTMAVSPTTSLYGAPVNLSATMSPGENAVGVATFYDGVTPVGVGVFPQITGQYTASTAVLALNAGTRNLTARALGNPLLALPVTATAGYSVNAAAVNTYVSSSVQTGSQPGAIVTGDFNSDGLADYAVANTGDNTVSVFLGNGHNVFTQASGSPFAVITSPSTLAAGDFNSDGKVDLAVGSRTGNQVSVYSGNGSGGFSQLAGSTIAVTGAASLTVADFNNDAILDLAAGNDTTNTLTILKGTGTGSFTSQGTVAVGSLQQRIALGDFNGDGNADLAVLAADKTVTILLGNGNSGFTTQAGLTVPGTAGGIVVADFNGDTKADIAVSNGGKVSVFTGNGSGAFTQVAGSPFGSAAASGPVIAPDLSGDGKADLAYLSGNQLVVLVNNGSASFTAASFSPVTVGTSPSGLIVADFNGDAAPELITANSGGNNATLLTAATPSFTALTTSPNPSTFGGSVTLTATITPSNSEGYVTFFDGVNLLGSAAISGGTASISTIQMAQGTHSVTARYPGIGSTLGSTSNTVIQTVTTSASNGGFVSINPVGSTSFYSVVSGDVNGDGKADLVAVNRTANNIAIWLGNGSGGFSQASGSPYTVGTSPTTAVIVDLNRDGRPDIAVTNSGSNTVTVLLQNANGTFAGSAASPVSVGTAPLSLSAGDFNGDGIADLAVVNSGSNNMQILLGDGAGGFPVSSQHAYSVGAKPVFIITADTNGDGKADLVELNETDHNVYVWLGNGDGTFFAWTILAVGSSPRSIAVGDFNGDGRPDLAISNPNDNTLSIFVQDSAGNSYQQKADVVLGTGKSPWTVLASDLNGDGKTDLAISGFNSSQIYIVYGNGNGTFAPLSGGISTGVGPGIFTIGDFTGDGVQDFAVANQSNTFITILAGGLSTSLTLTGNQQQMNVFEYALVATITPASATGKVAFFDGVNFLGTATLGSAIAGKAVLSGYLNIPTGAHQFNARYQGGGVFAKSEASFNLTLNPTAGFGYVQGTSVAASRAYFVAAGDLNGDGAQDFVTADRSANTVSVWLGAANFTGSFTQAASSPFTAGRGPSSVAISDFNSDGKPDLAVVNTDDNTVTILLGNGNGTFAQNAVMAVGGQPSYVVAGDFNNDGVADLAVANFQSSSNSVTVFLGTGSGTFTQAAGSPVTVGGNPWFIAVTDFDGDGSADLAVSNGSTSNVTVLRGNGAGGFTPFAGSPVTVGSSARAIAIGDFDGDGTKDMAVTSFNDGTVHIWLGNGAGAFTQAAGSPITVGTNPWGIAPVDYNGDGKLDLAVTNFGSNSIALLRGTGGGQFAVTTVPPITGINGPSAVAVSWVNNDAIPDLIVANSTGSAVSVVMSPSFGTTTVLSPTAGSSPTSSGFGEGVTLRTVVTFSGNSQATGGTMTFYDGTTILGTAAVSAVQATYSATFTTSLLAPGPHTLRAVYSGAGLYGPSSATATWTVNTIPSTGFGAPQSVTGTGQSPSFATTGDFNNDGRTDLALINKTSKQLTVYLGGNGGTLTLVSGGPYALGNNPLSAATGDFNRDGKPDIAVANGADNNVTVLLGNGSGGFSAAPGSPFAIGFSLTVNGLAPVAISVSDFNGDGAPDVATANFDSASVSILLGTGNGSLTPAPGSPFAVGSNPWSVSVGDFNADGVPDLVTPNGGSGNLTVLLGSGSGSFYSASGSPVTVGASPHNVAVGDWNGDGKQDLAVTNYNDGTISIFLGSGTGTFTQAAGSPITLVPGVNGIVATDFDGDHKADLVVTLSAGNQIAVLLGNGSGGFTRTSELYQGGPGSSLLATSSFSGSGSAELVVVNPANGQVSLVRSGTPSTVTLSSNANPAGFGSGSVLTATASSEGKVTFFDGVNIIASGTTSSKNLFGPLGGLAPGTHKLRAYYQGGVSSAPATSSVLTQTITTTPAAALRTRTPVALASPYAVTSVFLGTSSAAILNRDSGLLSVYAFGTTGDFFPVAGSPFATGALPSSVATSDVNGDRQADFVVTNSGSNTITVIASQGTGYVTSTIAMGGQPSGAAIADFNGDGLADIAVANFVSNSVTVLIGDGAGNFAEQYSLSPYSTGSGPYAIAAGDFNGDGLTDLVTLNNVGGNVTVLLGGPLGKFTTGGTYTAGSGPRGLLVGDYNGDGRQDLAVTNYTGNSLVILSGNGAGAFAISKTIALPANANPSGLAQGDINGDGKADLAVAYNAGTVAMFLGDGAGNFVASPVHSVNAGPGLTGLAFVDVNVDGMQDLLTVNPTANTIGIYTGALASSITLAASPVTLSFGEKVTLTATVVPATVTGIVTFYDGTTIIGSAGIGLSNGVTTSVFSTTTLTPGTHSFKAVYQGNASYGGSISLAAAVSVSPRRVFRYDELNSAMTGGTQRSLTAVDYNQDGYMDIVVPNSRLNYVDVLKNNGLGVLTPQTPIPVGTNPIKIVAADFNNDTAPDLAVLNQGSNTISILRRAGSTFTVDGTLTGLSTPTGIVTADFDNDGYADLAVTNQTGTVMVWRGIGQSSFLLRGTTAAGTTPAGLAAGDFDKDGFTDLVVINSGGGVRILYGDGTGGFSTNQTLTLTGISTLRGLTVADINNDGRLDIAIAGDSTVAILLWTGSGFTQQPALVAQGSGSALDVAIHDIDADGIADLIVTSAGSNQTGFTKIFLGNGQGGFAASSYPTITQTGTGLAVADFNGDGLVDIVSGDGEGMINTRNGGKQITTTYLPPLAVIPVYGTNATITANVSPAGATGLVSFFDGATPLGTAPLVSGVATFTTKALGTGQRTIKATYQGDVTYSRSTGSVPVLIRVPASIGLNRTIPNQLYESTAVFVAAADVLREGTPQALVLRADNALEIQSYDSRSSYMNRRLVVPTGDTPAGLAVADFNQDGYPDVIVTNFGDGTVSILSGADNFQNFPGSPMFVGPGAQSVAVADFTGDGIPDMAVTTYGISTVEVYAGDGHGRFTSLMSLNTGNSPFHIAAADFNNDGYSDLAVSNSGSGTVSIFLGGGLGSFVEARYSPFETGQGPAHFTVADFNGDGKLDLAVPNFYDNNVVIMTGDGTGRFNQTDFIRLEKSVPSWFDFSVWGYETLDYIPHGASFRGNQSMAIQSVVAGDFDGDSITDIAVTGLMTTVNHTFQFPTSGCTQVQPPPFLPFQKFKTVDKCLDGMVVQTSNTDSVVGFFRNSGNGFGLMNEQWVNVGKDPRHLAIADFDGDGAPDVITASASPYKTTLVLNTANNRPSIYPTNAQASETTNQITYTLTPTNVDTIPTTGLTITVEESNLSGFSILSMSGSGWSCGGSSCSRDGSVLNAGAQLPPITVVASPENVATAPLTHTVKVKHGFWTTTTASLSMAGLPGVLAFDQPGYGGAAGDSVVVKVNVNDAVGNLTVFTGPVSLVSSPAGINMTANAVAGVATFSISRNVAGTYALQASSPTILLGATTNLVVIPGNPAKLAFTTQPPASVQLGAQFSAAVQVQDSYGNPVPSPSGTFVVSMASSPAGVAGTLTRNTTGTATFNDLSFSTPGTYSLTANKSGVTSAQSTAITVQGSSPTTTALTASASAITLGGAVTLTATVTPSGTTGVVTFYDGVNILGSATLQSGTASLLTGTLPAGTRTLRARYGASLAWLGSVSAPTTIVVTSRNVSAFNSQPNLPVVQSSAVTTADINGDGIADWVIADALTNQPKVYLGNGDGTFAAMATMPTSIGNSITGVTAGDFNNDGRTDIIATSNSQLYIFSQTANGWTLAPFNTGLTPRQVVVGDFNNDGLTDLAVANGQGNVSVLLSTVNTGYQIKGPFFVGGSLTLAVADLNGDGFTDIAAASDGCPNTDYLTSGICRSVVTLMGDGAGNFTASGPGFAAGSGTPPSVQTIAVADLNGDGLPDLAIANFLEGKLYTLLRTAGGSYIAAPGSPRTLGIFPRTLAVADINGDGKADLVLSGSSASSQIITLTGNGDGTFAAGPQATTLASGGPVSLVVGDFNRDSRTDLLMATTDGNLWEFLGASPNFRIALTHTGTFGKGSAATWTIPVVNAGNVATSGTVTVTDTAPAGMTLTSLSGTGWTCSNTPSLGTCTRSDALAPGNSWPQITVTANIAANAISPLLNQASITGGGGPSMTITDSTIVYGAPAQLVFSTQPPVLGLTGLVANADVAVQDAAGVLVPANGTAVTISSNPSGVGGTLNAATANGIATFINLVFNRNGVYTLAANSSGLTTAFSTPVTVTGTNRAASNPTSVSIVGQPVTALSGQNLATVTVQVLTGTGNLATGSTAAITVGSIPAGVTGTLSASATGGIATFNSLRFNSPGSYTLVASSTGLDDGIGSPIVVTSPASKLAFTTPPSSSGVAGTGLAAIAVAVQDANGNLINGSQVPVTIASTPAGVSGTLTVNAINGVATFSDLVFNAGGSFTLTAASGSLSSAVSGSITIAKAPSVITWTNPSSIVYGTALSGTQLNALANVPGTFVYTPALGTILSAGTGQTLSVTFTPTDTAGHATATATVTINVTKATPVIMWANPAAITYGTALSSTQLNATAPVPGTFAYTPGAGATLGAGGGQTLSVTFTPTDTTNYGPATATTTITVNKATPVITWTAPAPITLGTALSATQLNATASVPGSFAYTPAAGTTLPLGSGQTLTATFTPTDTANYNSATATTTIAVQSKTTPVITWASPAAITYGTALSATQLNATASVPGTFAYTPAAGATLGAGAGQTLSVTFTPTDTVIYAPATSTTTITVNKATPVVTWAAPAAITYGTPLSATQLNATASIPGTFAYTPAAGTVLPAGAGQTLSVTFTPADIANYTTKTASTAISVTAVSQVIDVTPQIKATSTGLVLNRATNTYTSTLTVTNTGSTPIALPLQVVLTGLPAGVSLTSQTGTVLNGTYSGAPYMTVTGTSPLAPGASVSVALKFTNPANVPISYVTKALSGSF